MKKPGRRTLLTRTLRKKICDVLSASNTIKTACAACGIAESTYFDWISRGEAGEAGFKEFSEAVMRARARAKISLVDVVTTAAAKDWRAAAFLLERCYPLEYGRSERPAPVADGAEGSPGVQFKMVYNTNGKTMKELLDFPRDDNVPRLPPDYWALEEAARQKTE